MSDEETKQRISNAESSNLLIFRNVITWMKTSGMSRNQAMTILKDYWRVIEQ